MTENGFQWPSGQQCAVSLTYDDGLPVHYEHVAPTLERAGLRGTFYAVVRSDLMHHPEKWRELAAKGHELGNHTLFHPCRRTQDRERWLEEAFDLRQYTPSRFRSELEVANLVLNLIDGQTERSYGNTCCETVVGQGEKAVLMDDILADLFVAARGPFNQQVARITPAMNLMQVGHFGADGRTFEELKAEIEKAAQSGGWIVYMIHGIGPETHTLYINQPEHDQLVAWLGQNQDRFWTAPLVDVARYVRESLDL
jgi:sialate O-acetylesterase